MATKNLAAVITIGGTITGGLKSALGDTAKQLKAIGSQITDLSRREKQLGNAVQVFARQGQAVEGLRRQYVQTIQTVERLRAAQQRLATAQATRDRLNERAGKMRAAGAGMTVTGGAMLASVVPGVNESKHYQNEMGRIAALGMGDDVNQRAVKFAKDMKTFGTSSLENLELLRDGMSVFADLHHAEMVAPLLAKMKFANKAVFGSERGEQNSAQFMDMLKVIETRGGLKSEAEFSKQANIIQQVISATGGRVSATEWRHMLSTGGLAGKGMDSEALFYTFEHLVQEMGGDRAGTGLNSLYKSLYQGVAKKRSVLNLERFGLIGDKSKVKHDKAGQVSSMEPGALLGSDLFRANPFEWMEKVLLPQLAKKGITDEKQVIDTIGMIVSNSVGGSFLAEMYRQRENIHRASARNRGAQNIDQLEAQGRNSASGKELDAEAKLADAKLKLGNEVLPIYTAALVKAADALKSFNEFAEKHGTLVKAGAVAITGLGVALVVLGPVLGIAGGAMSLYAAVQLRAAAAAAAAASGIATETAAITAQGAAATTTAGKLAAFAKTAALAMAAGYAIDGIAGKFGVGKEKADQAQDDANWGRMNWWQKAESGLGRGIEGAGRLFFLDNLANQAQAGRVKTETDYLNKKYGTLPTPPSMSGAGAAAAPVTNNNTFNITQQPGESSDAFARRILEQLQRQQGVQQRGALTDGASHQ
jgi:hypothetical protein